LAYTANLVSQTYGTAIPTLAGTVTGFVLGQTQATATTGTLAFATPATQSSNVGSYAINGSGLTANSGNYTFGQAKGNATALTITPATLTFTATPVTDPTGVVITGLTGTLTGFVLGQNQTTATSGTLTFTTPANVSSGPGSYPIDGGLTSQNYVLVQAPGNSTALTLQVPVSQAQINQVTISTNNLPQFPTFAGFSGEFGGSFDGGGDAVEGESLGSTSSLPPDSGDADVAIEVGRVVVSYRTEVKSGREVYAIEANSLGMASSFTTFDKNDHPAMRVTHKARGQGKEPEKNDIQNSASGKT
jgi:hypothetical protein